MKKALFIIFLSFGFYSYAQDLPITENIWYVNYIVIDGEEIYRPNNGEATTASMIINTDGFQAGVCAGFAASIETLGESSYSVYDFAYLLLECDIYENMVFEGQYTSVLDTQDGELSSYTYELLENSDGTKTLTVTNEHNNQAVFGDQQLGLNESFSQGISIFPNPTDNILHITSRNGSLTSAIIFNVLGNVLITKSFLNPDTASIALDQLSSGVYFLQVTNDTGTRITKRLIKN